ncbi:hypothetical protein LXL04_002518 [Taraxacum kok-saghyz]
MKSFGCLKNKGVDLEKHCVRKIGDGRSTKFWVDLWVGDVPLKTRFNRIFALDPFLDALLADRASPHQLLAAFGRQLRCGVPAVQWAGLVAVLQEVSLSAVSDSYVWDVDGQVDFSVALARRIIDKVLLGFSAVPTRWNTLVSIKVNVLLWRIERNRIRTRLNLRDKGIDLDSLLCPFWSLVGESADDLFAYCPCLSPLWGKVAAWWNVSLPPVCSIANFLQCTGITTLSSVRKRRFEAVVFIVFLGALEFSEYILFGTNKPRKDELFDDVRYYSYFWISSRDRNCNLSWVYREVTGLNMLTGQFGQIRSGIQSKRAFLFGSLEMLIKLVPGNSAGTVTTYYLSFFLERPVVSWLVHSSITNEPQVRGLRIAGQTSPPSRDSRENPPHQEFTSICSEAESFSIGVELGTSPWESHTQSTQTSTLKVKATESNSFDYGLTQLPIITITPFTGILQQSYGTLTVCRFGCSETIKVKGLRTLTNKGCGCIPVCGMLIIGRREVDWSKLTGLLHLLWLIIEGLGQELVSGTDLLVSACVLFPPQETGGSWMSPVYKQLSNGQQGRLKWVSDNYMIYNYCADFKRFNGQMPPECSKPQF